MMSLEEKVCFLEKYIYQLEARIEKLEIDNFNGESSCSSIPSLISIYEEEDEEEEEEEEDVEEEEDEEEEDDEEEDEEYPDLTHKVFIVTNDILVNFLHKYLGM